MTARVQPVFDKLRLVGALVVADAVGNSQNAFVTVLKREAMPDLGGRSGEEEAGEQLRGGNQHDNSYKPDGGQKKPIAARQWFLEMPDSRIDQAGIRPFG